MQQHNKTPPSHFDMSCEAAIEKSNKEMLHRYFVYITTNENKTTIYIGMTNNIQRRLSQHFFDSQNSKKSFAGKYNCFYLIYYEGFQDPISAILREKEIKKWRREKKEKLINAFNPKWEFINQEVI
jgi:putative endonuclease